MFNRMTLISLRCHIFYLLRVETITGPYFNFDHKSILIKGLYFLSTNQNVYSTYTTPVFVLFFLIIFCLLWFSFDVHWIRHQTPVAYNYYRIYSLQVHYTCYNRVAVHYTWWRQIKCLVWILWCVLSTFLATSTMFQNKVTLFAK